MCAYDFDSSICPKILVKMSMNTNISKIHCLFTSLFNCSIYRHNMIWNLFNSVALQCQFTINLLIYNVYIWNWFLQSVFFVFVCLFYSFQSSLNTSAPIKLKGILFFIFNDWISALQATTYTHTHTLFNWLKSKNSN